MYPRTQLFRPELEEAAEEAAKSPDSHWTSNLSSAGMTRISRSVVIRAAAAPLFSALDAVFLSDHGFLAR